MMMMMTMIIIFIMHLLLTCLFPLMRGTLPRQRLTNISVASSHVINKLNTLNVTERSSEYKVELNNNKKIL